MSWDGSSARDESRASSEHLQTVFLNHGQQLERHTTWPLRAGFPFLNRGFAGVQVAREHGLADVRLHDVKMLI